MPGIFPNEQFCATGRTNSNRTNSRSSRCDSGSSASDFSLSSLASFPVPPQFERKKFNIFDNGVIRQTYADFALDRLEVPPYRKPSPKPVPTQGQQIVYADFSKDRSAASPYTPSPRSVTVATTPKTSHKTSSKRKFGDGNSDADGKGEFKMLFDMFQSPDHVNGDNDISEPLPLSTNANPLITQVTFEDELHRSSRQKVIEIIEILDD